MNLFKNAYAIVAASLLASANVMAQVPPAEQLLPEDTIGFATVPDWSKLAAASKQGPWGQLWADPAMRPFRENFTSNFTSEFVQPFEKELGIDADNYLALLQGQVTLALTPPAEGSDDFAGLLLLVDTKDKAAELKTQLANFKKKWTESGRETRTEKIRDTEFTIISLTQKDIDSLMSRVMSDNEDTAGEDAEEDEEENGDDGDAMLLHIGQQNSLLIVGENSKAIEKVLARQSGGLVPPIAEKAAYQKVQGVYRDSLGHLFLNTKPIYDKLLAFATAASAGADPDAPGLRADKILPALGFAGLESLAGKIAEGPEGSYYEFFAGLPEARREGLFKLLTLEKKDAAPPAFVPADVTKFQRTRIDAQKAWTALETTITRIDPSIAGLLQLMLSSAGKDQDPNFDLKKNLIGNLGDDFIIYEKTPRSVNITNLQSAPSLILIGSPNPGQLLDAMRMVVSMLPPPLSTQPIQDREFLGRKIYSITMATGMVPAEDGDAAPIAQEQTLSFTTSNGYVAFSTDNAILEEFLRSGENPPKPLRAVNGLSEAAGKIGGMDTGMFTYENQRESLGFALNALKKDPDALRQAFFFAPGGGAEGEESLFEKLFKIELLPEFDRISKYFHIAVATGATTPDGFVIKAFAPIPPELKR